jgi:hypothetical protein
MGRESVLGKVGNTILLGKVILQAVSMKLCLCSQSGLCFLLHISLTTNAAPENEMLFRQISHFNTHTEETKYAFTTSKIPHRPIKSFKIYKRRKLFLTHKQCSKCTFRSAGKLPESETRIIPSEKWKRITGYIIYQRLLTCGLQTPGGPRPHLSTRRICFKTS